MPQYSKEKNILPFEKNQKLQKVLAQQGFGSRRLMEDWIQEGRIKVNGKVAHLGLRVDRQDKIQVDGRMLMSTSTVQKSTLPKILLYNKPVGKICSERDPENRPSVFDDLPHIHPQRWIMVGRLDYNTSGLLLFTTDGELTNRLLHPRYQIEREYAVRVKGHVTPAILEQLKKGVMLEGKLARFLHIQPAGRGGGQNQWYHVVLNEGRNREVRRLWEDQGVLVSRLIRIRFGTLRLPVRLRAGSYQWLSESEVRELLESL
jgi:23S rRNA pseudouridine2605 synthase